MRRARAQRDAQAAFRFRTWGGVRAGAGPRSARAAPALPHRRRPDVRPYQPVHVTLRMAEHVWNLRSERAFAVVHAAIDALRRRDGFRVAHFTILGNHLHVIVEASGAAALAGGMRALSIRLARGLNRMMGRSGPVLEDRYHAHVLRTPAEVRNAVRYVTGNFAGHAARRGERLPPGWTDPFSSATPRAPRRGQLALWAEPVTEPPRTWLLRTAAVPPGHAQRGATIRPRAV